MVIFYINNKIMDFKPCLFAFFCRTIANFSIVPLVCMVFPIATFASDYEGGACLKILNNSPISMEVSERVKNNEYFTDGDLSVYIQDLHEDFYIDVSQLRSWQRWIDLGAGKAHAQLEFLRSFKALESAPNLVAYCYKLDRLFRPFFTKGKLRIHEGDFASMDVSRHEQADVISDRLGILSYSKDMENSLKNVFKLLRLNGRLYIFIAENRIKFTLESEPTKIIYFQSFLSTIPGLRVEGRNGILKITKLAEEIQIPKLQLFQYFEDAPPTMHFLVKN